MTDDLSPPFLSDQEACWAGEFGNDYMSRNRGSKLLASNVAFFAKALRHAESAESCIEFGANIGMNLEALRILYPGQVQYAIEINRQAAMELRKTLPEEQISQMSILDFVPSRTWELVLIKGVLIHINPELLKRVYEKLVRSTARYLLVAEYYSPTPVTVPYRGQSEILFKRDFVSEIIDRHPEMKLVDYGFVYRLDPVFPQDDINWFLLERKN